MAHHRTPAARRRAGAVLLATLLAIALSASPPAAGTAAAASPLRVTADTLYTLDPGAGRVHVEIDFTVTDVKPNSAQFIYFYRDLSFAIQPEATSVRANGSAGSVSTKKHQYFLEATVHLRANLYYKQTATFAIRYDLLGGAPRSASPIRVGKAFATFGVWAWGDVGRSTVEVDTPTGFVNTVDGDSMRLTNGPSGLGLRGGARGSGHVLRDRQLGEQCGLRVDATLARRQRRDRDPGVARGQGLGNDRRRHASRRAARARDADRPALAGRPRPRRAGAVHAVPGRLRRAVPYR